MRTLLYVLITCGFHVSALAQVTIRGFVMDAKGQAALPGATVFLANTTRGTTAAADGSFALTGVSAGTYQLVASYVGYGTAALTIDSRERKSYRLLLPEQSSELSDVVVRAKRRRPVEWENNLRFFTEHFISQSENAAKCTIVNPQVLYFEKANGQFIAKAADALLIENRGLGYRLKFQIDRFTYTYDGNYIHYKGYVSYDTLSPTDEIERQFWVANRRKAYNGSIRHFMRALYTKQLTKEGFLLRKVRVQPDHKGGQQLIGLAGDSTVFLSRLLNRRNVMMKTVSHKRLLDSLQSTPTKPVLNFQDRLEVVYIQEPEPYRYLKTRNTSRLGQTGIPQQSIIELIQPPVTVQADGQFFPPDGIRFRDYWSWELVAEELPVDYKP